MSDSVLKMKERIKIDLRTPMEQFFLGLMLLSPLLIFIGFHQMQLGDSPILFAGAILTFVLSCFCYFATDNYYLLDMNKRLLVYRFKFLFFERLSKVADFSGIHAVTVNTSSVTSKGKTSYFYVATLVLFNGKALPISDRESKKSEVQKLAEFVAKASGASYVQGSGNLGMVAVKLSGGRYTFRAESGATTPAQKFVMKLIAVIVILAGIPFIALIIYGLIKGN